jgi:hypothetical protein
MLLRGRTHQDATPISDNKNKPTSTGKDMNRNAQRVEPYRGSSPTSAEPIPERILSRIKLALLDEYVGEQRGHDPYDMGKTRASDVWGKRKRV